MKVVVMIPAYNEEKTIGSVIKSISRDFAEEVKVLIIDDGSVDKTVDLAKAAGADKIIRNKNNSGLGFTFSRGLAQAVQMGADVIVNIDADGQFDATDMPKLVAPIKEGKADMVTCTRFKVKELVPKMPFLKKLGNRMFTKIVSLMTGQQFTDTQCGFRAYSREAALRMNLHGRFTYTQEVFLDLINKGMRVVEVPCRVKGQREGKSRVVKNVFHYGVKALLIIILTIRDRHALKFFGSIGLGLFSAGFLTGLFLFIRWLLIGKIDPFMILVILSLILLILGFLMFMLGLIADMLERSRKTQEEILYRLKNK